MSPPKPAAVATALWMGLPCSTISGTPKEPPPIPISTLRNPTITESTSRRGPFGISSAILWSMRPKPIQSPISMPIPPKIACRAGVRSAATAITPKTAPSAIPGAHVRSTSQSTAPLRPWASTERADVTMIVASDVARQICISQGLS